MENKNKKVLIISLIALILVVAGASYAYFSARITGLESASTLSMTAGTLGIHYAEGDEDISVSYIYPKEEAWLTKTFTLTGTNTTELKMKYKVGLNIINNEFTSDALTYDLTHETVSNGKAISEQTGRRIKNGTNVKQYFGEGYFTNTNGTGIDHEYELKIYFKDNGKDQNINQGKAFNAKIFIEEGSVIPVNKCTLYTVNEYAVGDNCNAGMADLIATLYPEYASQASQLSLALCNKQTVQGISLEGIVNQPGMVETSLEELINKGIIKNVDYSPKVLQQGDYYINGQYEYSYRQEVLWDDTAEEEFSWQNISEDGWGVGVLNRSSTLPITTKLCTSINGKPIVSMYEMFTYSQATSIDLSSFDTSNVTDMNKMFLNSQATAITGLNSFDTSNVTDMSGMFEGSQAQSLDLSFFDTSNVTDMSGMFQRSQANTLNLSSFDTSNVTDMNGMFYLSQATTLDLGSFDTSNVTGMTRMFASMPNLTTIYASNKFDTSSVTGSMSMFNNSPSLVGGNGTTYDSNHVDGDYARIDGLNGLPGYFTAK